MIARRILFKEGRWYIRFSFSNLENYLNVLSLNHSMRSIHWNHLSTFEKLIFVLGWFSIFNLIFWVAFFVVYAIGRDRGGQYRDVFNPHTFKVPYVFGWINLVLIALGLLMLLSMLALIIPFSMTIM